MKTLKLAALFAVATLAAPFHAASADVEITAQEALKKVDVAGRQRMLSQRIAKAACLMAKDVSPTSSFDQLTGAYNLFSASDAALRNGDAELQLPEEKIGAVLQALQRVDEPWLAYRVVIEEGINSAYFEPASIEELDKNSLKVLKFMNIAVFTTAREYGGITPKVPLKSTITVDIAGRQRMLTQKAVKEACLMTMAEDPSLHASRLEETIQLFDTSLTALQFGYEEVGVMPAPTVAIAEKLSAVRELWLPVKATLERATAGDVLTEAELMKLASSSEPLLRTMNEAVGLYSKVDTTG